MGEIAGERVAVRFDPTDVGRIYVFFEDAFYCVAECPQVSGISRQEIASEARQRQKKRMQEARTELKRAARGEKTADIAREMMDAKREQAATLTQFPHPSTPHESAGLIAATDAANARDAAAAEPQPNPVGDREMAELGKLIRREQAEKEDCETADDRFRRWITLHEQADLVDQVNAAWMAQYEGSDEFRGRKFVYDEFGAAAFGG